MVPFSHCDSIFLYFIVSTYFLYAFLKEWKQVSKEAFGTSDFTYWERPLTIQKLGFTAVKEYEKTEVFAFNAPWILHSQFPNHFGNFSIKIESKIKPIAYPLSSECEDLLTWIFRVCFGVFGFFSSPDSIILVSWQIIFNPGHIRGILQPQFCAVLVIQDASGMRVLGAKVGAFHFMNAPEQIQLVSCRRTYS